MAKVKTRRRNYVVEAWDGLPPLAKGGVFLGGCFVGWRGYKAFKDNREKKAVDKVIKQRAEENTISVITTNTKDGKTGVVQHINLGEVATRLYNALHTGMFGWAEDEDAIMRELERVPRPYIPQLEQIWNSIPQYSESGTLQTQVYKALSSSQWQEVKYLFL